MCSYYCCLISNILVISSPLQDLTKKKVPFVWTAKEREAIKELKTRLVLVLLDMKWPFEVHCNACNESVGTIVSQEGHLIANENCHLNEQEHTLGIYEKELPAIIHALDS